MAKQFLKIKLYVDSKGEHRWRMMRSGRILADSAEGYKRRGSAKKTLDHILDSIQAGEFEVKENSE